MEKKISMEELLKEAEDKDTKEFDKNGIHKDTGTKYDPEGYDINRFDVNGIHKDTGTKLDPEGFNVDGINGRGFRRDGIHIETNTYYDPDGYDINDVLYPFNDYEEIEDNDIDEVSEEKVISIPEFLRKNRDVKKSNLEEKKEINVEEYTNEELELIASKLDSEIDELDKHKKDLEKERFQQTIDATELEIKRRIELVNEYRELQKELGESGSEFESYDGRKTINIDILEKDVEGITREKLNSYEYDILIDMLDDYIEENSEIEDKVECFKSRIRKNLIAEVRGKMDKKKDLEESIKKIERQLKY